MDKKVASTTLLASNLAAVAKFQFDLGCEHLKAGSGNKAASLFKQAANAGNVSALYSLGVMNFEGRGIPEDRKQGEHYLKLAARKGSAESKLYLAEAAHEQGRNEPAYRMFAELAAKQSGVTAEAQYFTGMMKIEGLGTPRDVDGGMDFLDKSADGGCAKAQCALAGYKLSTTSRYYDKRDAIFRLSQAAVRGSADAVELLQTLCPPRSPQQIFKAAKLPKRGLVL